MIGAVTCRSTRTGSSAGLIVVGYGRVAAWQRGCLQGENAAFGDQEPVGGNAERRMMVKASPTSTFEVIQADLIFKLLIISSDAPTALRLKDEVHPASRSLVSWRASIFWVRLCRWAIRSVAIVLVVRCVAVHRHVRRAREPPRSRSQRTSGSFAPGDVMERSRREFVRDVDHRDGNTTTSPA